jgi:hypothetical protein
MSGSKNRHTQHNGDLSINRGRRQCGLGSVQNADEILADGERVVARCHLNHILIGELRAIFLRRRPV